MTAKTSNEPTQAAIRKYESDVKAGIAALIKRGNALWTLGDTVARVASAATYGDKTVERYAADLRAAGRDVSAQTLRGYMNTAKTYGKDDRAHNDNDFTVFSVFASQDDALDLVKQQKWTVPAARDLVKSRRTETETPLERQRRIVLQMRTNLANAEKKLADMEAEAEAEKTAKAAKAPAKAAKAPAKAAKAPAKAAKAPAKAAKAPANVALHIVPGVPSHAPADCTRACPQFSNETARRTRHARRTA
jgi:hypothetical protein